MKITELIVRAARRLLEVDAALMGVRVCPITLEPSDVEPMRKAIQATIGKQTFLALSIPGAKTFGADRFEARLGGGPDDLVAAALTGSVFS